MGEPVFAFLAAAHSFRYRMDGCKSFCAGICGTLWIDTPDVGIAYRLLAGILARHCGRDSELSRAPGDDWKGKAVYRNLCHRDYNRIVVIRAGLCITWYLVYPGQVHREKSS